MHILFMVIAEMVKERTRLDALIIQVYKVILTLSSMHGLDTQLLGQLFNQREEMLKRLMRFSENLLHWAVTMALIQPCIDLIIAL